MTVLRGHWFDGKTSAGKAAEVRADSAGRLSAVSAADGSLLQVCDFSAVRISSRIGSTPRYLYFAGGEKFETQDHQSVDQLLQQYRPSPLNSLAHQLESHIYFVGVTLLLVVAFAWAGMKYGLPAASKAIAYRLPQEVMNRASQESLSLLDKTHFEASTLDQQQQERVLQHFAPLLEKNAGLHARVLFRQGGAVGANAFALPDGTILFTDEMVRLAQSDDELLAVLAHEIGHIKYRHSLRAAIQGTSVGFIVSMLTGDLSAASAALATLPVVLTTMSYSRDFEREADQNALDYLAEHNIDPMHFVTLMERVAYEARCDSLLRMDHMQKKINEKIGNTADSNSAGQGESSLPDTRNSEPEVPPSAAQRSPARKALCDKLIEENQSEKSTVMDYFSTHPATAERLQKFRQAH